MSDNTASYAILCFMKIESLNCHVIQQNHKCEVRWLKLCISLKKILYGMSQWFD